MLEGAPVTKTILIAIGFSSLLGFQLGNHSSSLLGSYSRILSRFVLSGSHEIVPFAYLAHSYGNVERIIGSSHILARNLITTTLTMASWSLGYEFVLPIVLMGSYTPCFIARCAPRRKLHIASVLSVSEKCISHLFFATLVTQNMSSAIFGLTIGILMYDWDGSIFECTQSNHVNDPIGATFQIQRKLKLDEDEQRMIQAQMARFRQGQAPQQIRRPAPRQYTPSPQEIQSLVAMGFPEDRVRTALLESRGDLTQAAERLVQ